MLLNENFIPNSFGEKVTLKQQDYHLLDNGTIKITGHHNIHNFCQQAGMLYFWAMLWNHFDLNRDTSPDEQALPPAWDVDALPPYWQVFQLLQKCCGLTILYPDNLKKVADIDKLIKAHTRAQNLARRFTNG